MYAYPYCSTVPHQASSIWIARPSSSSMNSALWVHPRWRGFCGFRQRQVPRLLPSAITGSAKPSRPVRRSSLLRKALGTDQVPELLTTVRQQSERERETTLLFREGKAGAALARKDEDSTLALAPGGYRDAVRRVAELWSERQQANATDKSYRLTVTAPTNEDARAISAAIRERRRVAGELARHYHSAGN